MQRLNILSAFGAGIVGSALMIAILHCVGGIEGDRLAFLGNIIGAVATISAGGLAYSQVRKDLRLQAAQFSHARLGAKIAAHNETIEQLSSALEFVNQILLDIPSYPNLSMGAAVIRGKLAWRGNDMPPESVFRQRLALTDRRIAGNLVSIVATIYIACHNIGQLESIEDPYFRDKAIKNAENVYQQSARQAEAYVKDGELKRQEMEKEVALLLDEQSRLVVQINTLIGAGY